MFVAHRNTITIHGTVGLVAVKGVNQAQIIYFKEEKRRTHTSASTSVKSIIVGTFNTLSTVITVQTVGITCWKEQLSFTTQNKRLFIIVISHQYCNK